MSLYQAGEQVMNLHAGWWIVLVILAILIITAKRRDE